MTDNRRHYWFGPRDDRALLAALGPLQLGVIGASLVLGVIALHLFAPPVGLESAAGLGVMGMTLSLGRIEGRSLVEWVVELSRFSHAGVVGERRMLYRIRTGLRTSPSPAKFASTEFVEVTHGGRSIGVILDQRKRMVSGVIDVAGTSLSLLDNQERERLSMAWSSVLAASATDRRTVRVKWIHETAPDIAMKTRASVITNMAGVADLRRREAMDAYLSLIDQVGGERLVTEQLLVVSLPLHSRWQPSNARVDRTPVPEGPFHDLIVQLDLLMRRLHDAGIPPRGPLTRAQLEGVTQRRFLLTGVAQRRTGLWPGAMEERWESLRTDELWHATFWIAEWPRAVVTSGFLLPLLSESRVRRTVALAMSPLAVDRAVHRAEQRRTSATADAQLRGRYGFALSSRRRAQHEAMTRREEELSVGHRGFEFSGYITVSAGSPQELAEACDQIEQCASVCHLELRRLYGVQRRAFAFGLLNALGCQ